MTLAELCRVAGISYSTVWRWQTERVSPTEKVSSRHLRRLEAALRARERVLRRRLGALAA